MTEAAASLKHRNRWALAWALLRGHEEAPPALRDESISFAELVWAHHRRQAALDQDGEEAAEDLYRRRLLLFKAEHGRVMETYWCRYEASGVALTDLERPRRLSNFFRRDSVLRFHTATDWRTAHANRIESALLQWETMAIRVSEILRDTSEKIALHRIFAASTRLIAFADRKDRAAAAADPELETILLEQQRELEDVEDFYVQAGENSARIVFFRGMILGTFALAALVGVVYLAGWQFGWFDPEREPTYTLFVTIAMGAAGAVLSVMTRMKRRDGWSLEWEVGRKSVRFLGGIRPWIGALFAFVLYLALKSQLVDAFGDAPKELYFYATVAFLAGFSERWAQVLLGSTLGETVDADDRCKDQGTRRSNRGRAAARR